MNKYLSAVKKFHTTFNCNLSELNDTVLLKERQLRIKLIFEELQELALASGCGETFNELCRDGITFSLDSEKRDKVEEFDALIDLAYVLNGTILSLGFSDKFDIGFDEVQRSNMSKACVSLEDAEKTVEHYFKKDGTESYIEKKDDKFLVYRTIDNKVLKSINYSPANLKNILDENH